MVAGPEIARVIEEFHNEQNQWGRKKNTEHHDQTASIQAAFARDVCSLVSTMEEFGNPFEEESSDLLVLDSKEIVDDAAVYAIQNVRNIGQKQFQTFIKECIVDRVKSIDDTIHRNKLKLFEATKPKANKEKQQMVSLKSDVGLFSQLYISCQTRDGKLEEFFCHENQAYPPALSDCGKLHLGTKSDLLTCLRELEGHSEQTPVTTCTVLDGAEIVQMLKPGSASNFAEYASQIFIPYVCSKFQNASRVYLVWDKYMEDTLKGTTRAKRGKGMRRRVVAGALLPSNWMDFLRVDSNKTDLFKFLSNALLDSFSVKEKQLVVTDGELSLHCKTLTHFPLAVMKRLTLACCCMQTMQHTMVITKFSFGQ